jgi:DNA polymerase-3 subunit alpha
LKVSEGYTNKEGKKGDPMINFLFVDYLQDVFSKLAKKLTIRIDVRAIKTTLIQDLQAVFQQNQGNHAVVFEVTEAVVVNKVKAPALVLNDGFEEEFLEDDEEEFSVGLVKEEAAVLETIPQKGIDKSPFVF